LFAYGNGDLSFMLIIGIALHGICYDFFFVSGQIYTNSKALKNIKCCSRSHYISHLWCWDVGFAVAGWITDNYKMLDGTTNWQMVWIIPAGIAFLVFFYYALLFDSKKRKKFKLFNKIIMSSTLSRRSV
jgi:hypothetical protein